MVFKISLTLIIPPLLWVFGDVDDFWMLIPCSFYNASKILDDLFKNKFIMNVCSVYFFDNFYKFVYRFILFFAILN